MRRIRIKGVNDMKEYAFGIDLGGTTAKVGLFTTSGKLLEKWEVSTDTSNNGAHILENLAAAVQQKMQEKGLSADEVEGVGLGVPGPVLDSSIVPIVCANLGGWGNRNVSIELSELLGGIRDDGEIDPAAKERVMMLLRQSFRPEFLNRLDEIVYYKSLTKDEMRSIVDLQLDDLRRRMDEGKHLKLDVTTAAKDFIIDSAYDSVYGARPIKRFIQSRVETLIAKAIIRGDYAEGATLTVDYDGSALILR